MYVCMYVCMWVCVYVCMYVCVYIYIYHFFYFIFLSKYSLGELEASYKTTKMFTKTKLLNASVHFNNIL